MTDHAPPDAPLLYEQDGPIVVLTMNRPEVRNTLTDSGILEALVEACGRISADASVRAVVLTGAGPAFSAGGNVKNMRRYFADGGVEPAKIRQYYRNGIQQIPLAVYNIEVPIIAAVNGPAIGAGCDLTCMCDIRIASENASFAESFVKLGIVPGDGGAWLLQRVIGPSRAAEMSFTGETINAQDALAYGLVSRVVPAADLVPEAKKLAARIAANPGAALRLTKRLLREAQHMRLDSLLEMSASFQALAHHTPQHQEAVNAFIEKRKPVFPEG
ncbi:MAG: crotonase/enoyl-CoA hydratase family protein [Gammaproteobacteria bacterium]